MHRRPGPRRTSRTRVAPSGADDVRGRVGRTSDRTRSSRVSARRAPSATARWRAASARLRSAKNGTRILGAAQGGIWIWNGTTWVAKTDNLPSLAIGALAVAPSNDSVVYAGTGEGALSGDSYFGNGILKSTDGGASWSHVSGDYFRGVSMSRLVVDPADANHLWVAIVRGRGGARRTSPPDHSRYGIWESKNGGVDWTLLMAPRAGASARPTSSVIRSTATSMRRSGQTRCTRAPTAARVGDDHERRSGRRAITPRTRRASRSPSRTRQASRTDALHGNRLDRRRRDTTIRACSSPPTAAQAGRSCLAALPTALTTSRATAGTRPVQCTYDNVIEVDPDKPDIVYRRRDVQLPAWHGRHLPLG